MARRRLLPQSAQRGRRTVPLRVLAPHGVQRGHVGDPTHLFLVWTPVALVVSIFFLWLGDAVFRRYEGSFAQGL